MTHSFLVEETLPGSFKTGKARPSRRVAGRGLLACLSLSLLWAPLSWSPIPPLPQPIASREAPAEHFTLREHILLSLADMQFKDIGFVLRQTPGHSGSGAFWLTALPSPVCILILCSKVTARTAVVTLVSEEADACVL